MENLWIPAVKAGEIEQVQNLMAELDPTLGSWEHYLTAVCRHLDQRGLLYILYSTQLFMKVSVPPSQYGPLWGGAWNQCDLVSHQLRLLSLVLPLDA